MKATLREVNRLDSSQFVSVSVLAGQDWHTGTYLSGVGTLLLR